MGMSDNPVIKGRYKQRPSSTITEKMPFRPYRYGESSRKDRRQVKVAYLIHLKESR